MPEYLDTASISATCTKLVLHSKIRLFNRDLVGLAIAIYTISGFSVAISAPTCKLLLTSTFVSHFVMAADGEDFQSGDSCASATYPMQCSALRKGGHVLLKSHPCKIVEMSTSKTGKHGHAKVHLVGLDVITNKKYEDICPSTHNMNVPKIGRTDFQLIDVNDGYISLMAETGETRDDIKLPESDLGKEIKDKFEKNEQFYVTVMKVMNDEIAVGTKALTTTK